MIPSFKNLVIICMLFSIFFACRKSNTGIAQRSYYMGFQNSAPRLDFDFYMQSLNLWSQRADAAMISSEVPWDSLFNGESAENYVAANYKGLTDYYRSKNFKLWVYIDPENGLDRTSDALELVALGKSIAQAESQQVYQRFAFVMDSMLQPDHLGLALETNLIRGAAPDSIYQGVKQAVNAAATNIRSIDKKVKMGISVQVEYAWGKLGGSAYQGVSQDFADFPFTEELGLSSYPYFAFSKPQDIPANYYSKLTESKNLPVFVSEGGWTSQSLTGSSGQPINSDPQTQLDYIRRQGALLNQANAIGVFQLVFTDLDLSALPPSVPASIQYFAYLGLVDTNLTARPALSAWDSLFKIQRSGN